MQHHLIILTGASRGLGLALAQQLLATGHTMLCIARHVNPTLENIACQYGVSLSQWTLDLADSVHAADQLRSWLQAQDCKQIHSITLINNAGVMPALVPLSQSDTTALTHALRVGLEAPMLLSAAFLEATQHWNIPRKVLNISSGLGHRAMASSSAYCAAKAGLDHFTRCIALEEASRPNGARVCSLAPGVIDTDMQVQLRQASTDTFPDQAAFAALHSRGQLTSPSEAAQRILAFLDHPDFGTHPVADVRG